MDIEILNIANKLQRTINNIAKDIERFDELLDSEKLFLTDGKGKM